MVPSDWPMVADCSKTPVLSNFGNSLFYVICTALTLLNSAATAMAE